MREGWVGGGSEAGTYESQLMAWCTGPGKARLLSISAVSACARCVGGKDERTPGDWSIDGGRREAGDPLIGRGWVEKEGSKARPGCTHKVVCDRKRAPARGMWEKGTAWVKDWSIKGVMIKQDWGKAGEGDAV